MACEIKIKALNKLKTEGIINSKREILNLAEFEKTIKGMESFAVKNYNLQLEESLFDIKRQSVRLPFGTNNFKDIYRAVPNDKVFDKMQSYINSEKIDDDIAKPVFNITFLNAQELVDTKDPILSKQKQDKLIKRYNKLQDIIKCIW